MNRRMSFRMESRLLRFAGVDAAAQTRRAPSLSTSRRLSPDKRRDEIGRVSPGSASFFCGRRGAPSTAIDPTPPPSPPDAPEERRIVIGQSIRRENENDPVTGQKKTESNSLTTDAGEPSRW